MTNESSGVDIVAVVQAIGQRLDAIERAVMAESERAESGRTSLRLEIDALRAGIEESTADLQPVHGALAELIDALGQQIEDSRNAAISTLAAVEVLAERVDHGRVDLRPVQTQLDALVERVDQPGLADQLVELRRSLDLSSVRAGITELVEAGAVQLEATERTTTGLRDAIDALATTPPQSADLMPVVRSLEALREHYDETQPDLDALVGAMTALRTQLVETINGAASANKVDLSPITEQLRDDRIIAETAAARLHEDIERVARQLHEGRAESLSTADRLSSSLTPQPVDLDPVLAAIDTLRADLPETDLTPLNEELARLRSTVAAAEPDLSPLKASLAEMVDSLASNFTESRNATERVIRTIAGIDLPDPADARTDLAPVLAAIDSIDRRLDGLGSRLDALQRAVDVLRDDETLRDAELRLTRRVDSNTEALRVKIDDQRTLADSLAANVSQLNAALTVASEEPQQLRRDLDRILEQLAERMGGAMRELRGELRGADEPLALRSSVEAGLDRITGRFQSDTGRILDAVTSAQEDADGRLRRIDNQVTELRRAVDRVRRDADRFEPAPTD